MRLFFLIGRIVKCSQLQLQSIRDVLSAYKMRTTTKYSENLGAVSQVVCLMLVAMFDLNSFVAQFLVCKEEDSDSLHFTWVLRREIH